MSEKLPHDFNHFQSKRLPTVEVDHTYYSHKNSKSAPPKVSICARNKRRTVD